MDKFKKQINKVRNALRELAYFFQSAMRLLREKIFPEAQIFEDLIEVLNW